MGTDLKAIVEVNINGKWTAKITSTGKWKERNYRRFGALANVRTDGPEPKGWPDDVSDSAEIERKNSLESDYFSVFSWETLNDAIRIFRETERDKSVSRLSDIDLATKYFGLLIIPIEDCRILFIFEG